jgi:hypothetical protein
MKLLPHLQFTEKMKAVVSSETMVAPIYQTTERHVPEIRMVNNSEYLKTNVLRTKIHGTNFK